MKEPIIPGAKLGRFEICSKIGAGGMGAVYLAHDTKLDRQVALKILPPELAANHDRMWRFVQEAKAAAALNHPNIAHVYEIGEDEDVNFIAMEFIDGVTLAQKIRHERPDLRKLLRYLQHTAEGLAKAHGAGIIHRDLKPDNIMITHDGHAKILDFGLAKLVQAHRAPADLRQPEDASTALMPVHSKSGVVMGTVGYMSPEQAEGRVKEIDQRSDIFSFGCILFEAVTGRQPFAGDSAVDSLYKTIYEPAPPITDFNPSAPADLQRIVRRCLAKDPEDRYQTIKDVAIELRDLRRELESAAESQRNLDDSSGAPTILQPDFSGTAQKTIDTTGSVSTAGAQSTATNAAQITTAKGRSWRTVFFIMGVGLAVLLVIALAVLLKPHSPAPFSMLKVIRITSSGKASNAAISPDGRYIVHVLDNAGMQSLQLRQVSTNTNQEIIQPAAVVYSGLTFSRDGNYIYYTMKENSSPSAALYRKPVLGGESIKLITDVKGHASLSPDGNRFAFLRSDIDQNKTAVIIANADGTGEQQIAMRKMPDYYRELAWSPDNKLIALATGTFRGNYHGSLITVPVAGGEEKMVTSRTWYASGPVAWLGDGSGLILSAIEQSYGVRQLWYVSYPGGEARQITHDLNNYAVVSLTSDSKSLVTVQLEQSSNIWVAPVTHSKSATSVSVDMSAVRQVTSGSSKFDGQWGLSWMPDGRLTYTSAASGTFDIWVMRADGTGQKQLTSKDRNSIYQTDNFESASPDGRYVFFTTDYMTGNPHVWRINSDGSDLKQLTYGSGEGFPQVTVDGRSIVYFDFVKRLLWKVSIDGGEPVQLTDKPSDKPVLSPDGKFIACGYQTEPNTPLKIAVIAIDGGAPLKLLDVFPTANIDILAWTPDSHALVYSDTRNGVSNLWARSLEGGPAQQLTDFKSDRIYMFDFSRDGKSLALARGNSTTDVVLFSTS